MNTILRHVLNRHGYVCASKTMALRRLLEAESSDTGFTSQEKGQASPCVSASVSVSFSPSSVPPLSFSLERIALFFFFRPRRIH